ncbi:MAG: TolC family protein [Proteobacteria bacterium]|nr:TolC family protein [Pseudomonadota bacterium]
MKSGGVSLAVLAALVLCAPAARAQTESTATLRLCYEWALQRSAQLKMRAEDIEQSRQRGRAAIGHAVPRLAWELTDTYSDPSGVRKLQAQGFSGFVEKEQIESKFTARQPIFSGMREFSAFKGFRREEARERFLLERERRELYERTAAAYYAIVGYELERENTRESLELAQDRVKDLKGFLKLGKARESEVFTAQAREAALKAASRRTDGQIAAARVELSFLTGQDLSARQLVDELPERPEAGSLAAAQANARERSDVKARREDAAASALRVLVEKGAYWPTLDALGRYYTKRNTFMKEVHWDAMLALEVPIFQGGRVLAESRRAEAARRQSMLALDEAEREAVSQATRLHGELAASLGELDAEEEAARAAQKSYNALREEYRLGLVTNLDVLQALDQLQAQRAARNAARIKTKRLHVSLGVATETLP